MEDRKTQDAAIRNLEIIGQALKDFGVEQLLTVQPDIPWREIAGMRNVLAHEYLAVDTVMVWETVQINLESLSNKRWTNDGLTMKRLLKLSKIA